MVKNLKDLSNNPIDESKPVLQDLGIWSQQFLPPILLKHFTKKTCKNKGISKSKGLLKDFATTYKIKWKESEKCKNLKSLDDCLNHFDTLNDLFTRKLSKEYTKLHEEDLINENILTSPAECRARIIQPSELHNYKEFLVKHAKYSLKELIGNDAYDFLSEPKAGFIFRLAPTDYHRFHSPFNAIVKEIKDIKGEYYSVDSYLLDRMPVLQKNHRKIVSFELKNGTKAVMAIVGATCVGTIKIDFKKNSIINKGDDIGTFKFGGSCLVLLLDKPCKYNTQLKTRSKKHLETYLTVGKPIATFI